jgi:predicted kinase
MITIPKEQCIIWTKGLPGSGKSSWAEGVLDHNSKFKRITKDLLREMLDCGKYSGTNEETILQVRDFLITALITSGYSVIVDDTNLAPQHEKTLKELAIQLKMPLFCADFTHVPFELCVKRDLERKSPVGKDVIERMFYMYMVPIPKLENGPRPAYIFDIDGTLAHKDGRSPFDERKYATDIADGHIYYMLKYLAGHHDILIVTGRQGSDIGRAETEKWLAANNMSQYPLFMRKGSDNRGDEVVKEEIYLNEIKGKYNILGVFDDRPRVVRMWRKHGLKVFNVGDGYEF